MDLQEALSRIMKESQFEHQTSDPVRHQYCGLVIKLISPMEFADEEHVVVYTLPPAAFMCDT